jgi:hypothetical protein
MSRAEALRGVPGALWVCGWDLVLAATFLVTWIHPYAYHEEMVGRLVLTMLLEFIVVHATGFFGAVGTFGDGRRDRPGTLRRALAFFGLFALYMLFTGAFALAVESTWPFVAFAGLMLPRFPSLVLNPPDDEGQFRVMAHWAGMTVLFLAGAFLTAVYEVPALGVGPEVVARQGFETGGLWLEEPHRVMAFGVFYFTGNALLNILMEIWERARPGS